jgi:hypothetical protein
MTNNKHMISFCKLFIYAWGSLLVGKFGVEIVVGELRVKVGILEIGFILLLVLKCPSIYYNQNGFYGQKNNKKCYNTF